MPTTMLIMTATIAPPAGAPGLARVDPALRMTDYLDALSFYMGKLGQGIDRILFVDNSDHDCTPLRDLAASRGKGSQVDIVSYAGLDYPPDYGRCYGEMRLLEHAMGLDLVRAMPDDTVFWKVTGRYKVRNLTSLVRTRPRDATLYCDLRVGSSPWFDMRVMAWTKAGFAAVLTGFHDEIREDLNRGRPGEETAYRQLQPRLGTTPVRLSLTREPLIDGVRAFDNQNWSQGRQKLVYYIRQAQRLLLRRVVI